VKAEQLLKGKGKGVGTSGKKLTEEREPRQKKKERRTGRRREGILPNCPDKPRFERYRSCSLLPLVLETQNRK
jgi:hypothetical protein